MKRFGNSVRLTENLMDTNRGICLLPKGSVVTISDYADEDEYYTIEELEGAVISSGIIERLERMPCVKIGETVFLHNCYTNVHYECEVLGITCFAANPSMPLSVKNEQFRYKLLNASDSNEIIVWSNWITELDKTEVYTMVPEDNWRQEFVTIKRPAKTPVRARIHKV